MADNQFLDRKEEDRRHLDRVWMYDDAWVKQEGQYGKDMEGMDVPEEEYSEVGLVGLLVRYPLMASFLILLAGGVAFIVIGLLLF
jgi:hypothetical protein